ncbi:glutathione S-transferase T3-like isoform X2 [Panicum miliaceum]|uniref:Glutathione S-transferase T3-like isoform X2 n=1 Tax=Panicum miliaceum TaxID=4540 RepID=A0A3L6RWD5_PANMI|nr:glutathione S-transferase T3-like isoform X2 [Panicum miliaceum]
MGLQDQETIDVVDDDTIQPARSNARADARTDRRLNWSNEEDIRLVSAWLHNSIDPVEGNDKKSDQYWYDVTSTYNSTTKCDRVRYRNQLKLRCERIKKPVTEFNGCYARIILHNMIIENENGLEPIPLDLNETPSTSTVQEATISLIQKWKK